MLMIALFTTKISANEELKEEAMDVSIQRQSTEASRFAADGLCRCCCARRSIGLQWLPLRYTCFERHAQYRIISSQEADRNSSRWWRDTRGEYSLSDRRDISRWHLRTPHSTIHSSVLNTAWQTRKRCTLKLQPQLLKEVYLLQVPSVKRQSIAHGPWTKKVVSKLTCLSNIGNWWKERV